MKRFIIHISVVLAITFGALSCGNHHHHHYHPHPILYATLYQQHAAEYVALCYQAFNLASAQLEKEMKLADGRPVAVIVDIDETILDNSPYQAQAIKEGFGYPRKWAEWVELAQAEVVPGALEFLREAESLGAEVFYITNRKEEFREATLRNLREKGLPFAEDEFLLLRTVTNDKEPRRMIVFDTHHVAVLIGDNLGDFETAFDSVDPETRMQYTAAMRKEFGNRYIMLPNAIYGTWVSALPGHEHGLHPDKLAEELEKSLKGF